MSHRRKVQTTSTGSRLAHLTDCFLSFGPEPLENIGKLTALAGELLDSACALYNRLNGNILCSIGHWNVPPDYQAEDQASGHICSDLILKKTEDWMHLSNLQDTPYADTDPNVKAYGLQTYFGHVVKLGDERIGSLCVVFKEDYRPDEEDREFVGILASAIAIEESRRATMEELQANEGRFRNILDALPHVAVQGYDKNGVITYWNKANETIYGYSPDEAVGRNLLDLIVPPGMRDTVKQSILKGAESGEMPEASELTLMSKDGSPVPVLSGHVVFDPNTDRTEMFCVDIGLKELKKAERDLAEAEERYRLLVEQLPAITYIVEISDQPRTIFISPQVQDILGFTQEEWIADPELWARQLHPDDRDMVVKEIERKNLSGDPFFLEYRALTRDGRTVWFRNHALFSKGEPGELKYTLGIMLDISGQKRAQEELEDNRRRMQASEKIHALGILAGGIAHDFNNLLMIILNTAYLAMETEKLPDEVHAYLEDIVSASKRSSELTHQLLAYSRRQPLSPSVLDINQLVIGMESMLRRIIGEDIDLSISAAEGCFPVKADRGQIEQVVVNLAVNARDAMPRGGALRITTEPAVLTEEEVWRHGEERDTDQKDFMRVTLSDSGVGMTEEVMAHIFEPFYTTKGVGRGTGLGLSSSYGIVKQHGGFLFAESTPGKGSAFRMYIPLFEGIPDVSEHVADGRLPRGSETILVAEDEPTVRRIMCIMLEQLGYNVIDGGDGSEALKVARAYTGSIDLLVTDIVMPGVDGVDLAKELRKSRPALKVVFASGYPMDRLTHHGIRTGHEVILKKPFERSDVARAVHAVLDS
ncbi:MAG: PAS domain S-box protein [Verrucomicrobia bacterium]|nr:PAS domain S-box protein [Verrucomicrobiota bacterium]